MAGVVTHGPEPLGGRYRLIEQVGAGGMSVVWRGYDEVLGRRVAVKVLASRLARDRAFRDRLRIEARAAAQLCHPNITGVYDYGESPDGVPYVVMELVDGDPLAVWLARLGRLPWERAVTVCAEVAAALAAAHARGVVHRDVTPSNVLLTADGAKVVDFGISALVGQSGVDPDGQILGTLGYLAPERVTGQPVSPATDVYALGLVLYRALAGRTPWPAGTATEQLRAHMFRAPAPLPELAGLPDPVADLVLRCLAKAPDQRPTSAEVAAELSGAVGRPMSVPVSPAPVGPSGAAEAATTAAGSTAGTTILPWSVAAGSVAGGSATAGSVAGGSATAGSVAGGSVPPGRCRRAARALLGRRPVRVAALVAGLLGITGAVWAGVSAVPTGGGEDPDRPGVASAAGTDCQVEYALRRDTGREFDAAVTVTNPSDAGTGPWSLTFMLPGAQEVTAVRAPSGDDPVGWEQRDQRVTIRSAEPSTPGGSPDPSASGTGDGFVAPGATSQLGLTAGYTGDNPLPVEFRVGGERCRARVSGLAGGVGDTGSAGATAPAEPNTGAAARAGSGGERTDPGPSGVAGEKARPGKPPKPAKGPKRR